MSDVPHHSSSTAVPPGNTRLSQVIGREEEPLVRRQVGRSLVLLRTERELSQQDLAARAAVSKSYLSQIESGLRLPSAQVLERLAQALEVSPADVTSRAHVYPAAGAALGVLFGGPFLGAAAGLALGAAVDAFSTRRGRAAPSEAAHDVTGRSDLQAGLTNSEKSSTAGDPGDSHGLMRVLSQLTPDDLERVHLFARALLQSRPGQD